MEIFQFSLDISCMSLIVTTVKEGSGRLLTTVCVDKANKYVN